MTIHSAIGRPSERRCVPVGVRSRLAGVALIAYDSLIRPRMLNWGATLEEQREQLPGDEVIEPVMTHNTRALTIDVCPESVWPWLVQIGDRRAGFYSYDWIESYLFPGMVHRVDGKRSAVRIHPELQDLHVGDRIDTASIGKFQIGRPVTILEQNEALVIGSWAFILRPVQEDRTRLLVRERDAGWLKYAAPRRSGLLRTIGSLVDYLIGEPLHFTMVRKMMLGVKERAEATQNSGK